MSTIFSYAKPISIFKWWEFYAKKIFRSEAFSLRQCQHPFPGRNTQCLKMIDFSQTKYFLKGKHWWSGFFALVWLPVTTYELSTRIWLPLELIDKCVYFAKTRGENTHFLHKLFRLLATNSRMLCHTIVVRVVLHWVMNSRERWWCIHHQISDHGWLRAMFDKWN